MITMENEEKIVEEKEGAIYVLHCWHFVVHWQMAFRF
jgi:hypothetical protein